MPKPAVALTDLEPLLVDAKAPTQALLPLLLGLDQAAQALDITRAHLHRLSMSGKFGPMAIRLGRSVKISRIELEQWVAFGCPPREKWLAIKGK